MMAQTRAELALCLVAALGASALGTACGERSDVDAILADSVYAQVVARLQLIATPADTADQREADSARARILADYGVTADELLAFAEVAGREPERSRELWEEIGGLVDSIREADGLGPADPDGALRVPVDQDTLSGPGIRAGEPGGGDPEVRVATPVDSPKAVRGERPRRPLAGEPVRQQ